jgi:hypothetical protein
MTIEINWHDKDPESGKKRFLCAEKFARVWRFSYRYGRYETWQKGLAPTREMWEFVLDGLKRRYRRREGVDDQDVAQVERLLKEWKEPPTDDDE